jgi:hypothetical protein
MELLEVLHLQILVAAAEAVVEVVRTTHLETLA